MKIVYFDCFAGISGDMTLGAFLDCGVSPETLRQELEKLGLPGFHLEIEKTKKRGITGTSCRVAADREEHCHRHFAEISGKVGDPQLCHALFYQSSLRLGQNKLHTDRPLIPSALHRSSPPLWGAPLPGAATAAWASLSLPRMDAFFNFSMYS